MFSVCLITKNEAKWISGLMENLLPLQPEFIVCDTGSTDLTKDLAHSYGARVYEIPWTNDFSEARNRCLKYATRPWILRMDPDERIAPRQFDLLNSLAESKAWAIQCPTRAYTNATECIQEDSWRACRGEFEELEQGFSGFKQLVYTRLFRNDPRIHFVGKIHESIDPTVPQVLEGEPRIIQERSLIFHHYGISPEEVKEKAKGPLYAKLMEEEIKKPNSLWYVWNELGVHYLREENYPRAIEHFRQAAERFPTFASVYNNWAYALMRVGNTEQAIKLFEYALELDPVYAPAWLNRGLCEMDRKRPLEAIAFIRQSTRFDPGSASAWRALGQASAQCQQLADAESFFKKSLEILPHYIEAQVDLAILWLHQKRHQEAQGLFRIILNKDPQNERALHFYQGIQESYPSPKLC